MIRIGLAAAAFVFLAAVLSLFLGRSDAELETRKVIDAANREMKQPPRSGKSGTCEGFMGRSGLQSGLAKDG